MSKKAAQEENGQNIASWRRKNPSSSADQKGYVYCRQPRKHTAVKGFHFPPDSLEIKKMDIPTVMGGLVASMSVRDSETITVTEKKGLGAWKKL